MLPVNAVSRRTLLKRSAAAAAGVGLSGLSWAAPASALASVTQVKNLIGTGTSNQYGIGATDLGISAICPDGRSRLFVFGDTFGGNRVDSNNNWRSPTALYSSTLNLAAGITFSSPAGGDRTVARQLFNYQHGSTISTIIPSDVITIGSSMFIWGIVNGPGAVGSNVLRCGIWRSDDNGMNWSETGFSVPPNRDNGMLQQVTWGEGNDGFVYLYGTGAQRNKGLIMYRVPSGRITDLQSYQPWGFSNGWRFGVGPTPIVPQGTFGEICLRPVPNDGKWLFTYFQNSDQTIRAAPLATPTDNLVTALPASTQLLSRSQVPGLYGGYVVPGITLSDFHITVSQWIQPANDVYHVMQYRVRGLV